MSRVIALKHSITHPFSRKSNPDGAIVIYFPARHRDVPERGREPMESTMVRRIKEALHGSYSHTGMPQETRKALEEILGRFTHHLQVLPYRQLVEEGYVNQLLDDYLGLLIIAHEKQEQALAVQYADEREYYYSHPQVVKEVAIHLKYCLINV